MSYEISTYAGDEIYTICTTDCCVGDEICFERATFCGYYKNAVFDGFEKISGKIIADSYGKLKQQHTFTILKTDGEKIRIKGRNLYKNCVYRKKWHSEAERINVAHEKHERGDKARAERYARKYLED